jgi:lauroyl/myristoyl acyltransferase
MQSGGWLYAYQKVRSLTGRTGRLATALKTRRSAMLINFEKCI